MGNRKSHAKSGCLFIENSINAPVAELADAYGSGPYFLTKVQVRFLSGAPNSINPNLLIVGDGFGFIVFNMYPNFNSKKDV